MSTNSSQPDTRFNRYDALILALVAALAVVSALSFYVPTLGKTGELTVVLEQGGEEVERLPLSKTVTLSRQWTQGGQVYDFCISIDGEGVWVESSTCPTQDCVHTGRITRAGQSIVCLPAQLVIHLEGASDSTAPDVMVG